MVGLREQHWSTLEDAAAVRPARTRDLEPWRTRVSPKNGWPRVRGTRAARASRQQSSEGGQGRTTVHLSMSSDTDDDSQFKRYNSSCMCARQTWALQKQYAARAVLPTPTAQDTTYRHAQQNETHWTLPTRTLHSVQRRMVQSFGKYGLERNGPRASWPATVVHWTHKDTHAPRTAPRRVAPARRARSSRVAHDAEDLVGEGLVVEAEVEAVHAREQEGGRVLLAAVG